MNQFEKACSEIEKDAYTGENTQENAIEFLRNAKTATATFCQGRYITRIRELAKKNPGDVQILHENPDGSIVAHFPVSYIHISNLHRELTDEQKQEIAERLRNNVLNRKQTDRKEAV